MPRSSSSEAADAIVLGSEYGSAYTDQEREQIARAAGAYSVGMPDRAAARAAMVSPERLNEWLLADDEHGLYLRMCRAKGQGDLHAVVHREAINGASHVACPKCKAAISECPHCCEPLPERGDPKWAAWLLEKTPEYRQKVELGPLQEDFESAAKMSEQETSAQLMRAIAYPDGLWLRAIEQAFDRPGPELAKRLQLWAVKHSFTIESTATGEQE